MRISSPASSSTTSGSGAARSGATIGEDAAAVLSNAAPSRALLVLNAFSSRAPRQVKSASVRHPAVYVGHLRLEINLDSQLDLARKPLERVRRTGRSNRPYARRSDSRIRIVELRRVCYVESLGS
jgi:hypothetical protein